MYMGFYGVGGGNGCLVRSKATRSCSVLVLANLVNGGLTNKRVADVDKECSEYESH